MPPVRTANLRQTTLPWGSKSNAPAAQKPTKSTPVVINSSPHFERDHEWEDRASQVVHGSKRLSFGKYFDLTNKHVDDLIAMGPDICEGLWIFVFTYGHNEATGLTDDAVKRLAQSCPGLLRVELPGTAGLTHEALVALFENCPHLVEVEITCASGAGGNNTGAIFALLLKRKDLAPKLRKLRVDRLRDDEKKAMRAVTKQRKDLLVQVVWVDEVKKWGHWEVEVTAMDYRKGRKLLLW